MPTGCPPIDAVADDRARRDPTLIQDLSVERQILRRLTWRVSFEGSPLPNGACCSRRPRGRKDQEAILSDARRSCA